jgi:hypothetical protein
VYVFAALACARQFHHLTVAGIDIVTFATFAGLPIALATMLWTMRRARHRMREAFPPLVRFLAIALGALALLGMVWTALPVVLLSENC